MIESSKVSVIVPVYNVEQYLERCLDSLLNQSYTNYEIICINDCSPDNSGKILQSYAQKYVDRIKLVENQNNIGLGLTRERGLNESTGDYVLFVDSDDYVKPDYIESYITALDDDYDIVVGGYIRDCNGKHSTHLPSDSVWSLVTYALACTKLFKKSFIEQNRLGFTDVACGEDIYFSLCAFICDPSYKVIPYAGYYYYFNDASITGSMDYSKNHEALMSELFRTFLTNHNLETLCEEKKRVIEYCYMANMVNALAVFNRGCGLRLMKKKLRYVRDDLAKNFPDYKNNPYIGILKPKGQTLKIRLGVSIPYYLSKLGMEDLPFYLFSLM